MKSIKRYYEHQENMLRYYVYRHHLIHNRFVLREQGDPHGKTQPSDRDALTRQLPLCRFGRMENEALMLGNGIVSACHL